MTDFVQKRISMVDTQVRPSDVTKFPIINAMLTIAREQFIPDKFKSIAYVGDHIILSKNRVLLDPRIFAKMLDALEVKSNQLVLVIGCGSGYGVAIISQIAEAVVGVDNPEFCVEVVDCKMMNGLSAFAGRSANIAAKITKQVVSVLLRRLKYLFRLQFEIIFLTVQN